MFLGPRGVGKTSIFSLWNNPEINIGEIGPTISISRQDVVVSGTTRADRHCHLCVYDFPGELICRLQALRYLRSNLGNSVLVLMFDVDGRYLTDNARYYSRDFESELREVVSVCRERICKAIIVFNKIDLLSGDWNDEYALDWLVSANLETVSWIVDLFPGNLEFRMTSALMRKGIRELLQLCMGTAP